MDPRDAHCPPYSNFFTVYLDMKKGSLKYLKIETKKELGVLGLTPQMRIRCEGCLHRADGKELVFNITNVELIPKGDSGSTMGESHHKAFRTHAKEQSHQTGEGFLMSWDLVPGSNEKQLRTFLKEMLNAHWVDDAEISKTDDGQSLTISKGNNWIQIMLDRDREKATLQTQDGREREVYVVEEGGHLNVYRTGSRRIGPVKANK